MTWRMAVILAGLLLLGLTLWQRQTILEQERRIGGIQAANAVLIRQAGELLREREASDAALTARETARAGLEAARNAERGRTATALGNSDFRVWHETALPEAALELLREQKSGATSGPCPK